MCSSAPAIFWRVTRTCPLRITITPGECLPAVARASPFSKVRSTPKRRTRSISCGSRTGKAWWPRVATNEVSSAIVGLPVSAAPQMCSTSNAAAPTKRRRSRLMPYLKYHSSRRADEPTPRGQTGARCGSHDGSGGPAKPLTNGLIDAPVSVCFHAHLLSWNGVAERHSREGVIDVTYPSAGREPLSCHPLRGHRVEAVCGISTGCAPRGAGRRSRATGSLPHPRPAPGGRQDDAAQASRGPHLHGTLRDVLHRAGRGVR